MNQDQNLFYPFLLACLGSILIGSSGIFVRMSDLGPITTAFYRMLVAVPLLAVWVKWEHKNGLIPDLLPREAKWSLLLASLFFSLDLSLWNWALDYTTIVNATLFNNTAVFFAPLLMWIFFNEKPSLRFLIAIMIGFFGCFFLLGGSFSIAAENLNGDFVSWGSGIMLAAYLIAIQKIRNNLSTGLLMFWTGVLSLFFFGIFALVRGESFWPLSYIDILSFCGQAILIHVIGQSFLAYSLGKIPATYTALILLLAPVTGAILGWVIYAEILGMLEITGMILVMASILVVSQKT